MNDQENNKVGRPTEYTKEKGDAICSLIASGKSLKSVVEGDELLPSLQTVFSWLRSDKQFLDNYTQATEQRTDAQLEQLNEMGEEAIAVSQTTGDKRAGAVVQAYKLKADNMKWVMARMKPKKYGDKLDMTSDGKAITVELVSYARPKADNKE